MAEVPKAERLVNLVIALLEARRPQSFADLRRRTGYWSHGAAESARRQFERDKDELRALGVPIETRPVDPIGGVDGYIIDRRAYEQPDIHLTPEEATALALVVAMTQEPDTRLAVARLAPSAPPGAQDTTAGSAAAHLALGDAPFAPIARAVVERRSIEFAYRASDGTSSSRRIDPWALLSHRGSWYLVGHDHERRAVRAFRLDRLQSAPSVSDRPGTFEIPEDFDPRLHVEGPVVPAADARVAVSPMFAWEAQSRGGVPTDEVHEGFVVHEFGAVDPENLAIWVVGLAGEAVALAPPSLQADVLDRLHALREAMQ